jgi:C4-dicarboxylate-specific signal transduction histidine kinase
MDALATIPASRRRIEVETGVEKGGAVAVSIRDNGVGFKSDGRQLFEPFYTTKDQGLGLGLALCSTIVDAHGGTLTLENCELGGAMAKLALPAEEYRIAAQ